MPDSSCTPNHLNKDKERYINLSMASSTKQTYSSGEKRFVEFIHLFKGSTMQQCLPASEAFLTEFVVYLAKKHQTFFNKNLFSRRPSFLYSSRFSHKEISKRRNSDPSAYYDSPHEIISFATFNSVH